MGPTVRELSSGYFKGSSLPPSGAGTGSGLAPLTERHGAAQTRFVQETCFLSVPTHLLPPLLEAREAGAWVQAQLCCSLLAPLPKRAPQRGPCVSISTTATMPDFCASRAGRKGRNRTDVLRSLKRQSIKQMKDFL